MHAELRPARALLVPFPSLSVSFSAQRSKLTVNSVKTKCLTRAAYGQTDSLDSRLH